MNITTYDDGTKFLVDTLSGEDFVMMAKLFLGKDKKYEDDVIIIEKEPFASGSDFTITRKKLHPTNHLRVTNPVTMESDGQVIRHHGEHVYLVPHLKTLIIKKFDLTNPLLHGGCSLIG